MEFGETIKGVPAFHKGTFTVEKKGDCFVDMSQWGKGAVWVNERWKSGKNADRMAERGRK